MNADIKLPPLPAKLFSVGDTALEWGRAAVEVNEQRIINAFLERTGQYVTNDASREAAIQAAVEADRRERGEPMKDGSMSEEEVREKYEALLIEVLDAKEVMRARGVKQAAFSEMFRGFAASRAVPSDDEIAAACRSLGWDLDAQEEADMILLVRTVLAGPTGGQPAASACVGCEGHPAPGNNPCGVCGKTATSAEKMAVDMLVAAGIVSKEKVGEALAIALKVSEPAASAEPVGIVRWRSAPGTHPGPVVEWNGRPPEDGVLIYAAPVAAQPAVTEEMVSRFLGWKLPKDFYPDCGITFTESKVNGWPSGTNLFHAGQVKEMLEYVLGAPVAAQAQPPIAAIKKLLSNWDDLKPGESESVDAVRTWVAQAQPVVNQSTEQQWPFVEPPGHLRDRLVHALRKFDDDLLAAIRYVFIENPVALAQQSSTQDWEDAERYRWLRTPPNNLNPAIYGPTGGLLRRDEYLDAAIDAARAAKGGDHV